MLDIKQFSEKVVSDLSKIFPIVDTQGELLHVGSKNSEVSIPIETIFREFKVNRNYDKLLKSYTGIIGEILEQYNFKIDYRNVYPVIESADFGKNENNQFFREHFALDLDFLYVSDIGETFRFVLKSDNVDFDKVSTTAWENLKKISNVLEKLDNDVSIFSLKYGSDYGAISLLSPSIQAQIRKKIGNDYLFAVPTPTNLILAKYNPEYVSIIKTLMLCATDSHKISNRIYRYKNGTYDYADTKLQLSVVK